MTTIEYRPIGVIHSQFKAPKGTPIQATGSTGVEADIEVFPPYAEGLADLTGFSHIFLIYHFHLSRKFSLKVKPFLDDKKRGLFATRAPARPNPIGISVVRLVSIKNYRLRVLDIDIIDKTPLLDIKPYVPQFDVRKANKIGWIKKKVDKIDRAADDGRFCT
ncbi:MAG: tRNA (N6-threonylcarbamoyladenosine(37)-N6)-methyltransferase TrmO [Desulfobacterales bacterium]|nr:tRNA (N6-threonylcarbamoyladenosine(37)-N6)-methyltransferase TrmO [Desulfobacterales bacterium]